MNINSPDGDLILRLMLLAIPMGFLTERAFEIACHKLDATRINTHVFGRQSRLLFNDVTIIVMTLVSSGIAILPALIKAGPSAYLDILSQARVSMPIIGWPLTIIVFIEAIMVVVIPVLILIGQRRRQQYVSAIYN